MNRSYRLVSIARNKICIKPSLYLTTCNYSTIRCGIASSINSILLQDSIRSWSCMNQQIRWQSNNSEDLEDGSSPLKPKITSWGKVNREIQSSEVHLVLDSGGLRRNVLKSIAQKEADELKVDLVEIATENGIPICRMFDVNEQKRELKRLNRAAKKESKLKSNKDMIFGVKIEPHDRNNKVRKVLSLLKSGHRVKITVKFDQFPHMGAKAEEVMESILEGLANEATYEPPSVEASAVHVIVNPKLKGSN